MTSSPPALHAKMASQPAFGTFIKLGRREVVEVIARAGFDFAICDLEHSQISEQDASHLIVGGIASGLPIIVRLSSFDAGQINRLLEAGAAGIQLPQVQRREQVAAFRSAMKYPPEGSRSISLAQPAAGYGSELLTDYVRRANSEVLLVGQVETQEIEHPLEKLIEGLDVVFIGILDMTLDMGLPGRFDDPQVVQRQREIEIAAAAAKVHVGIYADSPVRAAQAAAAGYRYIALSSDLGALSSATRSWVQQLRDKSAAKA
jgi:2-keto-3-deoxy-L-rhamnonate aldolase RhmA